ncbi:hypothetical protein GGS23DRAFT_593678 [Durotheca rogersii]|uniref:uncharacterized protein n=1 Tax=Durotheca rogersii TaxID=419775 RepID=UPI00221E741C|nr:uncharacterized protein GGS23DRAFT_593678 [Durotheca rogersii]KAI5866947.1 hypothetical protein GGS23DRAFT_593678 [Durotheca rogersii]
MSVFSLIRRARAQAKEHSAKQAEKEKEETVKLPYKHVVTHAAADALATAPASWKDVDRARILEQTKRRTALAASDPSMSGLPRVGSSSSYNPYAAVYATPVVPLPKNYSYSSVPASWREPGTSRDGPDYISHPPSAKGKERASAPPSGFSRLASEVSPAQANAVPRKVVSPNGSSGTSSGSDEELEIRNTGSNHRPQSPDDRCSPSRRSNSNRRILDLGTFIPAAGSITPSSSSTSGAISSTSSTASIGIAIGTPGASYSPPYRPSSSPAENYAALGRMNSKETTWSAAPTQAQPFEPQRRLSLASVYTASTDTRVSLNGQSVLPAGAPAPRRRRRLSKTRPPDSNGSVRMSSETVRPTGLRVDGISAAATTDLSQANYATQQQGQKGIVAAPNGDAGWKKMRRFSKSSDSETARGVRWPFWIGSKTSAR